MQSWLQASYISLKESKLVLDYFYKKIFYLYWQQRIIEIIFRTIATVNVEFKIQLKNI